MTDVILRILKRQSDEIQAMRFIIETKFRDNDIQQKDVNDIIELIDDIQTQLAAIIKMCMDGVKP